MENSVAQSPWPHVKSSGVLSSPPLYPVGEGGMLPFGHGDGLTHHTQLWTNEIDSSL